MQQFDTLVIGAGISGMSFAFRASVAGCTTAVLEASARTGGCLHSHRTRDGYWFELGAHTAYNSYGGLLDMLEGCGLMDSLVPRAKVPFKLLDGGQLMSITQRLSIPRAMLSVPRVVFMRKEGRTVRDYFSRIVGRYNYDRVLRAFLAAVPSQPADDFPATMLFKKRPRRKSVLRSFTLDGGLGVVTEHVAARPNITVVTNTSAVRVARAEDRFEVTTASGTRYQASTLAIATDAPAAASLLAQDFPALAQALSRIVTTSIDTVGAAIARDKLSIEPVAGIVPLDDIFYSAVTRDTVPDDHHRGFAFHFAPGHDHATRVRRVTQVLGVSDADLIDLTETRTCLPSPTLGHEAITDEIDRLLAGSRLAITGNYFAGLAIEDCVARSTAEHTRVST